MNKLIFSSYILLFLVIVFSVLFFILVFTIEVDETIETTGNIDDNQIVIPYFDILDSINKVELLINGERFIGEIIDIDSTNIVIKVDNIDNSEYENISIITNRTKIISVIINKYFDRFNNK